MTLSDMEAAALAQRMLEDGSIYTFAAYADARSLAEWVVAQQMEPASAQSEYDADPALQELLTRASRSGSVQRGRERRTPGTGPRCLHCGEGIVLDEHRVWHHTADGALVCGVQVATPQEGR